MDLSKLSPGMQQYMTVKQKYPDCLVLFRMGDFYEIFYEDAKIAARELEITLTSRGKGDKKAPLAGIPYHALEPYLAKLVKKGHKVVICEQLEDPRKAKGLVKRDVVRIITPGTVIESSILEGNLNNYLMSIYTNEDEYALALCDVSTGEFLLTTTKPLDALQADLTRFSPSECLVPVSLTINQDLVQQIKNQGIYVTTFEDRNFRYESAIKKVKDHFKVLSLEGFGLEKESVAINAAGGLLAYLQETQLNNLEHINKIKVMKQERQMALDSSTIRNLELLKNIKDGSAKGSLISVLDFTNTAMGARLLKKWIKEPLLDLQEINARLNAVETLKINSMVRDDLNFMLKNISDIERLVAKVNYKNANPRDLLSLKHSLKQLPSIKEILVPAVSKIFEDNTQNLLKSIYVFPELKILADLLESSIREDAPVTIREGGMIKPEFNPPLKELHEIKSNGRSFILKLEELEKEKTGIKNLRIGFNNVFGYYIEVSKSNLGLVPQNYIRKQTIANGERYITEELKIQEEKILGAEEKLHELEFEIFQSVLNEAAKQTRELQELSEKLAILDVLLSFATAANEYNYAKPIVDNSDDLILTESRHPVVEQLEKGYIANDISMEAFSIHIITGPNMAGKSSYLRQVALNVLMAQIGCFCAATYAKIGLVDRIFTRVGAYDDLSTGQSTFMVEMLEAANILNNATSKSLIILDEIGRGTSTYDGVALAWSIVEFIYNDLKAKTLFATHYHVLNKLETQFEKVKNFNIAVRETEDEIIFIRKVIEGGTDRSYGIHVAKLAGVPKEIVDRAREIQEKLESEDKAMKKLEGRRRYDQKRLL